MTAGVKGEKSSSRPYRLGKRAEAATATRQRIIDAGWSEIERAGYRPATIESIAGRAGVTRMTVYRHFATRGELLEAIAWDRIGRAQLERLDAARLLPDVVQATDAFLHENCDLLGETGGILRAMLDVERDEPELAAVLGVTYRGRRLDSIRQLADRIVASRAVVPGWTPDAVADAVAVLTSIETFEHLSRSAVRSPAQVATALSAMTSAFLKRDGRNHRRTFRATPS